MTPADVIEGRARWCVVEGDSATVLRALPAASVHAVVTDPPAGIAFMGAEWDHHKGGRSQWVAWLASVLGLARVATVPGGRAIVWALPRTAHWTGCAVEDAGWAIESKLYHLFGTGWPKGRSQLKPSAEEWLLARTGPSTPLNVDGCRVGTSKAVPASPSRSQGFNLPGRETGEEDGHNPSVGRWPPNLLLSHTSGCVREGVRRVQTDTSSGVWESGKATGATAYGKRTVVPAYGYADPDGTELVESWRCVEGCPVAVLDAQSGECPGMKPARLVRGSTTGAGVGYGQGAPQDAGVIGRGDTGTASRFFPKFPADDPDAPFRYIAKPSRAEKNAGCEELEESTSKPYNGSAGMPGRSMVDGEWVNTDAPRKSSGNHHSTVKPIELMRWLVRLVTQPGDIVLDPFGGSGTTGVAALMEGRRVMLVEREPAYAAICRARLAHAAPTAADLTRKVAAPIAAPAADFGPLFGGKP
jgi:site-specific DNA-methyltransferase (adenine-specific)